MAKKITSLTNYNAPTVANPDGTLKDRVYDTDGETVLEEGSRIQAPYVQDMLNVFHRAGRYIGRYLNDVADTQIVSQFYDWFAAAIAHGGSRFGTATAAATNSYGVTLGLGSPQVYKEGLTVSFVVPSTNTSSSVFVNVNSLGIKNIADSLLGTGIPATTQIGSLIAGDIVTLVYTVRTSDAYGYFRVRRTSLSQLANGDANITATIGTTVKTLRVNLDQIYQYLFEVGIGERVIDFTPDYIQGVFTYSSTWTTLLDFLTARISVKKGTVESAMSPGGLNFVGGPNTVDTSTVKPRFYHYKVPNGGISFITSASYPDDWYGDSFSLNTGIGSAEILGQPVAHYRTNDGIVKVAPVLLIDTPSGTRSGVFNVVVKSGDATLGVNKRPVPGTGNAAMTISFWYDGSGLA